MKTNDKDTFKVPEKQGYKKRFLVRKHEEREAEELIKKFKEQDDCTPSVDDAPRRTIDR